MQGHILVQQRLALMMSGVKRMAKIPAAQLKTDYSIDLTGCSLIADRFSNFSAVRLDQTQWTMNVVPIPDWNVMLKVGCLDLLLK